MNGPIHDAYVVRHSGITVKQRRRPIRGLFIPLVLSIVLLGMANNVATELNKKEHLDISDCVQVKKNIQTSVSRAQAVAAETEKEIQKIKQRLDVVRDPMAEAVADISTVDTFILSTEKDVAELKASRTLLTKSCEDSEHALILNSQVDHIKDVTDGVKDELSNVNRQFNDLRRRSTYLIEKLEAPVADRVKEALRDGVDASH